MTTKRKTWKNGDKFRTKVACNGYMENTTYVVNGVNGASVCGFDAVTAHNVGQWIATSSVRRLENTKAELEEEKAELVGKVADLEAKIKFLDDNSLENYDEQEFKIYQALTVLDETTNKLQKTKQLAALLKDLA